MLHILGAGCASPETRIDNTFLAEIGLGSIVAEFARTSGIEARHSVLPLEYIKNFKNVDPAQACKVAIESPTDLAFRAAKMAIERAGITPEQLTCIIGDGSTPFQSTPSEAQRVGERLGMRLPAYDAAASAGPIPLHLDLLLSLKEERVPEYCLCISSHTPTCRVNYTSGLEGFFLGDGASALVVSTKHRGKLAVEGANYFNDFLDGHGFEFDSYEPAKVSLQGLKALDERLLNTLSDAMKRCESRPESMRFVLGQAQRGLENQVVNGLRIPEDKILTEYKHNGFTLSTAPTAILARNWDNFKNGETLICAYAGAGLSYGNAILKVI